MRKPTPLYVRTIAHGHPRADYLGHVLAHVLIAEKALGKPLPPGAQMHHVDENGKNNANTNLVICQDHAYHKLLHVRARIVKAGGNPNTEKFCRDCGQIKPLETFNRSTGNKATGRQSVCRLCQKIRFADFHARQQVRA